MQEYSDSINLKWLLSEIAIVMKDMSAILGSY